MVERSNVVPRATKASLSANSSDVRGQLEITGPKVNSVLFNTQGQLMGVIGDKETTVLPAYYVEQALLGTLSDRQAASLGVTYQELYREPLTDTKGVLITARPIVTSPAGKAGIQLNDRILAIDGKDLSIDYTYPQAQARYFVGDTANLKVSRGDQTIDLEVSF